MELGREKNLRARWIGTWSPEERKLRLFRIMWETYPAPHFCQVGHTLNFSITRWRPRVAHHSGGGRYA
jgi:hypothetical protein